MSIGNQQCAIEAREIALLAVEDCENKVREMMRDHPNKPPYIASKVVGVTHARHSDGRLSRVRPWGFVSVRGVESDIRVVYPTDMVICIDQPMESYEVVLVVRNG